MMNNSIHESKLGLAITRAASKQSYYTIRFLADRDRVADAYRAYAYFRWVDDILDTDSGRGWARSDFIRRQKSLLANCYGGGSVCDAAPQEKMLIELIRRDQEQNSGLRSYLYNMMNVMEFDAERRGGLISESQLTDYTRWLAIAVTEAMHYFIGHGCHAPHNEARYLAVTAAHITHMLRDTFDDLQAGYFNIPVEVLNTNHISPQDIQSDAYRAWVRSRVQLARKYFNTGREYMEQVENRRFRLAGLAYTARFECVLDAIEREQYYLRSDYPERKGLGTFMRAGGSIFPVLFHHHERQPAFEQARMRRHLSK